MYPKAMKLRDKLLESLHLQPLIEGSLSFRKSEIRCLPCNGHVLDTTNQRFVQIAMTHFTSSRHKEESCWYVERLGNEFFPKYIAPERNFITDHFSVDSKKHPDFALTEDIPEYNHELKLDSDPPDPFKSLEFFDEPNVKSTHAQTDQIGDLDEAAIKNFFTFYVFSEGSKSMQQFQSFSGIKVLPV